MRQKAALAEGRSVIRVSGSDSQHFLHNILTNDPPEKGMGSFAGLLTPQGKIMFDFLMYGDDEGYLIDVPSDLKEDFLKRLMFYKLRADVVIEDSSADFSVVVSAGDEGKVYTDPRHEGLGNRGFVPTDEAGSPEGSFEEYESLRISLGVPEGGKDYVYGDNFPHDACYDFLNGVIFTKGCYVGQEVVSRMKHRGTARKRIVHVHGESDLPQTGDDITSAGNIIGRLGSVAGTEGLGLVRIDRAGKAEEPILVGDVLVTLSVPEWAGYAIEG